MAKVNMSKVNPFCPIFRLKIGDTDFTLQNSPEMGEYVISFSMNRSAEDMANDIVIQLFDKTALMIEWYVLQGYKSVEFQYGMDETNLSKVFKANIKDYSLSFQGSRTTVLELSLQLGEITDSVSNEESKTYKSSKPSEVVKMIAKEQGWKIGNVVDTRPVSGVEYFNRQGQTPEDFIKTSLVPKSIASDGRTDYTFYIDYNNTGEACVYFLPKDTAIEQTSIKTYQIVIGGGDGTDPETVISFTPNYGGILQALTGNYNAPPTSTNTDSTYTQDTSSDPNNSSNLGDTPSTYTLSPKDIWDVSNKDNYYKKNPMSGTKIYAKNKQCKVYNTYNSKTGKVVATLVSNQYATIMDETPSWYKVKTNTGRVGYVRKVDCTIWEPVIKPYNPSDKEYQQQHNADSPIIQNNPSVETPSDNPTDANINMNNLSIEVPSIDSLTNTLVKPYPNSSIKRVVGSSSYTDEEAGKVAEYLWTKMSALDNTAELVLRGDASFYIQSFVTIIVLTPDGFFHHSSGIYQVLEIVDDIEGGSYTTTLNMVKRTLVINDDGSISPGESTGYLFKNNNVDAQYGNTPNGTVGTSLEESNLRKVCNTYNGLAYSQAARLGPNSYDCSSMVNTIMGDLGIKVNWATTAEGISKKNQWGQIIWQSGSGTQLTKDMIKTGYVGCYNQGGSGHTWIFINQTTIFHAAGKKKGVLYADLTDYYVKKLNSCSPGRAVVWAPPASTGSPVKNIAKSRNYPNL